MTAICPICEATIEVTDSIEMSEIITCSDCQNKLEVKNIQEKNITLVEAPKVEEDWGE